MKPTVCCVRHFRANSMPSRYTFQNRSEILIGQFFLIVRQPLLLVVSIPPSQMLVQRKSTKRSVKESWLVEFNPPVTGAVTLRATGKQQFTEQTALPLVWVESAVAPKGRISIQSTRASRPSVLNHHLIQLPPSAEQSTLPIHSVVELLYDESALAQTGPSVEVLPDPNSVQSVARAWVWREFAGAMLYICKCGI